MNFAVNGTIIRNIEEAKQELEMSRRIGDSHMIYQASAVFRKFLKSYAKVEGMAA